MKLTTDYLVLGSGIAGLTFALRAAEFGEVTIVTKRESGDSATNWAQGGMAAVLSPDDSFEKIVETFHQPLPKVLRTGRDGFDISSRDLREEDYRQRDNPRDQHRICNRKFADLEKGRGLERKSFMFGGFGRQRYCWSDQSSDRAKSNQLGSEKIAMRKH